LESLRPLLDLELDHLVLEEAATAVARDLRVVNEDVRAVVLLDEAPALLVVEPLHLAHCHRDASTSNFHCTNCNFGGLKNGGGEAADSKLGAGYERSAFAVNLDHASVFLHASSPGNAIAIGLRR